MKRGRIFFIISDKSKPIFSISLKSGFPDQENKINKIKMYSNISSKLLISLHLYTFLKPRQCKQNVEYVIFENKTKKHFD